MAKSYSTVLLPSLKNNWSASHAPFSEKSQLSLITLAQSICECKKYKQYKMSVVTANGSNYLLLLQQDSELVIKWSSRFRT